MNGDKMLLICYIIETLVKQNYKHLITENTIKVPAHTVAEQEISSGGWLGLNYAKSWWVAGAYPGDYGKYT